MLKRKRVNSDSAYTVVNISIEHKERVKNYSEDTGYTIASIVETAIDEFLEKNDSVIEDEDLNYE